MINLCGKKLEDFLKDKRDYNNQWSYESNTYTNSCLEITIEAMEHTNQYKEKEFFYDTKRNELVWAWEGYSYDGLIEYCTFDYYEFVVDFIKRHNLPKADKFIAKLEEWFPEKCIDAAQAGIFLDDVSDETQIETQKITRKIGAFSDEEKATTIITKAELNLEKLYLREFYHKSKLLISRWCAENSIPFTAANNYWGFDDSLFEGDLVKLFYCTLLKKDKNELNAVLGFTSKVSLDSADFNDIELQKKGLSDWEKYADCSGAFVDDFSLKSVKMHCFHNLPSGEYRLKAHFFVSAQSTDMKIYEQEGLFYSKEIEVN